MLRSFFVLVVLLLTGCGGGSSESLTSSEPRAIDKIQNETSILVNWSRDVGTLFEAKRGIRLPPVLANGFIYTIDQNGKVWSIDAQTGAITWQENLDKSISAGLGAGDGLLVTVTERGGVIAIDASNGETRWQTGIESEVLAPPAIAGGVVIVRAMGGKTIGLAAEDGSQLWQFSRKVPALSLRGASAPVIRDGIAYIGSANGKIYASNIKNGDVQFEVPVSNPEGNNVIDRIIDIDARPVVVGSVLYVATYRGNVMALALGSRRILWSRRISVRQDFSADADNLYLVDEEDRLLSLDRLSGSERWLQEEYLRRRLSMPVTSGGHLVVADFEGYVHVIDIDDGHTIARKKTSAGSVSLAPIVSNNQVLIAGDNGKLISLSIE